MASKSAAREIEEPSPVFGGKAMLAAATASDNVPLTETLSPVCQRTLYAPPSSDNTVLVSPPTRLARMTIPSIVPRPSECSPPGVGRVLQAVSKQLAKRIRIPVNLFLKCIIRITVNQNLHQIHRALGCTRLRKCRSSIPVAASESTPRGADHSIFFPVSFVQKIYECLTLSSRVFHARTCAHGTRKKYK